MSITTVYFSTTAGKMADYTPESLVRVQPDPPTDWEVLFECHLRTTDLIDVGDGQSEVSWQAVLDHPYRISTH